MTECSVSCLGCATNGAGLCDNGKCMAMTIYDSTSKTCKGMYVCMYVISFLTRFKVNIVDTEA